MDELEVIQKLARQARREQPPKLHVAAGVLAVLRVPQPLLPIRPLAYVTIGAAAAAILVLALSIQAWTGGTDPLATLFPSLEVSLL